MGGRVYDPELGRFLSADLFVQSPYSSQSFNRYSYGSNSPISRIDPSGYSDESVDELTVTGRRDDGGSFWNDWSYGFNYGDGWGAADSYFDYANAAANTSPIDVSSVIQQPTSPDNFDLDGAMEHVPVTEGKNGVDEITVTGCCKNARGTGLEKRTTLDIYAVARGIVTQVGWENPNDHKGGNGYRIQIQEGNDIRIYGHLDPDIY